jgi:hypothetical protein
MLDSNILSKAKQLQSNMNTAYAIFKKNPTTDNANSWGAATRSFNEFCVKAISDLLNETKEASSDVTSNIEAFKNCKQCGAELLFPTVGDHFIASSDFLEEFPGWCYSCLVEHCQNTDCSECKVSKDPVNCSFKIVKEN